MAQLARRVKQTALCAVYSLSGRELCSSREAHVLAKDEKPSSVEVKQPKIIYADMAQSVEHVLGKDGVGSSNLPISSKKNRSKGRFSFVFLAFFDR